MFSNDIQKKILTTLVNLVGVCVFVIGIWAGISIISFFSGLRNSFGELPYGVISEVIFLIYLLYMVWVISTGAGIILKKPWARFSFMVFAGFILVMGIVLSFALIYVPVPHQYLDKIVDPDQADMYFKRLRTTAFLFCQLILILLPFGCLILFNKKFVKEMFLKEVKA